MSHVLIVVPCYNEALRLQVDAFTLLPNFGHRIQFLFVNDGSKDDTLAVIQGMSRQESDRFLVLDLPQNSGKAEAVRQGFLEGFKWKPDHIGFWDADLATPLEEIPNFIELLEKNPTVDMVFGSRVKLLGRTIERHAYRHYFGRIFATAVSGVLELPIYDSQCGAKLFRNSEVLRSLFEKPFMSRWVFDVELLARYLVRMRLAGRDPRAGVYELPLSQWQDVKGSKVQLKDGIRAFSDLLKIRQTYLK